ncbi:MAG: GDP-L-fucose synthase [Coriobacteriia bacterium]|nr:GDP-L-fucose synthase [Coriobacteriia bacterium]
MRVADKIFVAGHNGLVGSAIVRELTRCGYTNLVTATHAELDLTNQVETCAFFEHERPAYVFLAAAKVGGIGANAAEPAPFIHDNLAIALNVIDAAYRTGVTKLCNLGSSCIYPRDAAQPMAEAALLTGPLEPTNEPYAIAKIAAIKLCEAYNRQYGTDFISLMPTNLYGPGDNYDLTTSHVLPAMIARFDDAKRTGAKTVTLWGDGTPQREFLYVDDLANAAVFLMERHTAAELGAWINVGSGEEVTIAELANLICATIFTDGMSSGGPAAPPTIEWDATKPNGTPRKLLDSTRLTGLGWQPKTTLADGLAATYAAYLKDRP